MKKITEFFWICSGADRELLRRCRTESSRYAGIGATIFFTGIFAALAGAYALFTVFDSVWAASVLGLLWGGMIFNLDRYIVSSMRKEGRPRREFLLALPRIILAVIISIVIAKPLELKIFEKEIEPELILMEQQKYAEQEDKVKARFLPVQDSLKREIEGLKTEVMRQTEKRDALVRLAQEEADGTGGSKRRNLGPIYKVKKANADSAQVELIKLEQRNGVQIKALEAMILSNDSLLTRTIASLERGKMNGPAGRMEALATLTKNSSAMAWAHWFIMLLFIAIETAPVFVKLISSKGPYDNLLAIEEHTFYTLETEEVARINTESKGRAANLPVRERDFVSERLDAKLNQP
jgi:hypothetical protein